MRSPTELEDMQQMGETMSGPLRNNDELMFSVRIVPGYDWKVLMPNLSGSSRILRGSFAGLSASGNRAFQP